MNNLAEILNCVYDALKEHEFHDSDVYPLARVKWAVNASLNDILRDLVGRHTYQAKDTTNHLVNGTAVYDYPADLLERLVLSVWWKDGSGVLRRLVPATADEMDLLSRGWRNAAASRPEYWLHDKDEGKLRLHPAPSEAVNNGLIIYYVNQHPTMYRFWGTPVTSSLTVNVTNGSTGGTLSATPTAAQMIANDYFGVIAPKPGSTTGIAGRSADYFYVAGLVVATLTLTENFQGATEGAAYFVTGQPIDLLVMHPTLGWALVYRTVRRLLELTGEDKAGLERFVALYEQEKKQFRATAETTLASDQLFIERTGEARPTAAQ